MSKVTVGVAGFGVIGQRLDDGVARQEDIMGLFEEAVGMSGKDIMFAISIPQESVAIPETIDGFRAALEMQTDRLEGVALTNQYLGIQRSAASNP